MKSKYDLCNIVSASNDWRTNATGYSTDHTAHKTTPFLSPFWALKNFVHYSISQKNQIVKNYSIIFLLILHFFGEKRKAPRKKVGAPWCSPTDKKGANGGVSTHPFKKFRSSLFKGLWVLRAKP